MKVINVSVYIILTLTVLNIAQCENRVKKDRWREHNQRVAKFSCEVPQPRSIEFKELVNARKIPDSRNIHPHSTVLHRCGAAGCCQTNKKCVPTAEEEVTLLFLHTERRNFHYIEIKAQNHTRCGCQHHMNMPK